MITLADPHRHVAPCGPRHTAALAGLSPAQRSLVEEALTVPLTYMANALFDDPAAERALFEDGLAIAPASTDWYHPVLEARLAARSAPRACRLSVEEEKHLFLRYNYARWRAALAVERFRAQASKAVAEAIALWYGRVKDTRDLLARANLALVLAMAKRVGGRQVDFGELVSEGNLALLRTIEAFDVARGFKFSTYACRAIRKAFFRLLLKVGRYRAVFPTEFDPAQEWSDYREAASTQTQQDAVAALEQILRDNRARLSDVEQTVIQSRFALHRDPDASAMTLAEVGRIVGMTKERVRQIQNKALAKLRAALESEALAR
jgi:RNA polymerase sigma factor (sigma-70 family)